MLKPLMIGFFLVMISIGYDGHCFILAVLNNFYIDSLAFNIETIDHGINHLDVVSQ